MATAAPDEVDTISAFDDLAFELADHLVTRQLIREGCLPTGLAVVVVDACVSPGEHVAREIYMRVHGTSETESAAAVASCVAQSAKDGRRAAVCGWLPIERLVELFGGGDAAAVARIERWGGRAATEGTLPWAVLRSGELRLADGATLPAVLRWRRDS